MRDISGAFKPDGITDNRKAYQRNKSINNQDDLDQWNRLRRFAKEDYRIDLMDRKIKIRNG